LAPQNGSTGGTASRLVSRARFLALVGVGGVLGYGGMRIGGRTVKGWRYNTVESQIPSFDRSTYTLKVDGLIENPFTVTYEELRALPAVNQVSDFRCVEGWGVDDVRWEGVRFQTLAELVAPRKDATFVTFYSEGDLYTDSLTINQAMLPDVLLAYSMFEKPLEKKHGYPLRLVMPRMYGYKGPKWLKRVEFTANRETGYWERRGWKVDAWIS
jgi:DMSO/TMAO reductase YedYZ molybdopterin-dependent catalytic subunit